ncbi:MAG TPA: M1 family metallopeptidase, partial [Chryseosolibacter sp.]|nr:M1 family metallopeptidase [Chryseosolibacter sp.]
DYLKFPDRADFSDLEPLLAFPNHYRYSFNEELSDTQNVCVQAVTEDGNIIYTLLIDEARLAIKQITLKNNARYARGAWNIVHIDHIYQYREYRGQWFLSYCRRNWKIENVDRVKNTINRTEEYFLELLINDIKPDIQENDLANLGKRMIANKPLEFQSVETDDSFWKYYNVIESDSLASGIKLFRNQHEGPDKQGYYQSQSDTIPKTALAHSFTQADTLRGKLTALRSCYDVTFYDLDVTVDIHKKYLSGSNVIRFKVQHPFDRMQIDLYANMKIDKILWHGKSLQFSRRFNAVFIDFPEMLSEGESSVAVYYEGTPQEPNFDIPMNGGFLWGQDDLGNPWVQVVCQGSGASLWWPNKDHLSDEPDSMHIAVTVPAGFMEISNGRLINKKEMSNDQWRYEWAVTYPINNYNATINIGKYEHWRDYYITDDTLTIDYYAMPYHRDLASKLFAQTKLMLSVFEKHFGKYPFPRDGFTLMESLYPMEHQSCVSIGRITKENFTQASRLLWHEASHEWWGNNISCIDMAELWIHEAFATYSELLMIETTQGTSALRDFLGELRAQVTNTQPVVGIYDVNHIFYDIGDMYSKGMLMLYTLRKLLNDDNRWSQLLRDIQKRFQYSSVTNKTLIQFINGQLGVDYNWLFNQYLYQTNLPVLRLNLTQAGKDLQISFYWQAESAGFKLPVSVTTAKNTFGFIYPTAINQFLTIRDMEVDEFKVDQENFYLALDMHVTSSNTSK